MLTNTRSERVRSVRSLGRRAVRVREGLFLAEGPQAVREALAPLAASGLDVAVREVAPDPEVPAATATHLVTVYGADRLGIVARLVGVVAEAGANVTDLTTRLSGELYVLLAEVALPSGADAEALRSRLDAVAADLGVGVTLRAAETDEL